MSCKQAQGENIAIEWQNNEQLTRNNYLCCFIIIFFLGDTQPIHLFHFTSVAEQCSKLFGFNWLLRDSLLYMVMYVWSKVFMLNLSLLEHFLNLLI